MPAQITYNKYEFLTQEITLIDKGDKLENKNFKDKESLIEEEEKVKNFEFQDVSANNSKDGIINNKES